MIDLHLEPETPEQAEKRRSAFARAIWWMNVRTVLGFGIGITLGVASLFVRGDGGMLLAKIGGGFIAVSMFSAGYDVRDQRRRNRPGNPTGRDV